MNITRRAAAIGGLGLLAGTSMSRASRAGFGDLLGVEGLEEFWLATDAYVYGYPLVTMEMTRRVLTNVAAPEGTRGPMGQIIKIREYPNASFRDVTAPNADTLYTTSFFDVGKEPWVLGIPDMNDRYYLAPMLDGWTNVFQVPGKRTTGTKAQTYAITGPGWQGTLPAGVKQLKSPTNIVWLLGRIYCTGTPEDYAAVHKLQDRVQACSAERLWQALHAAAWQGRSVDRHEDGRSGSSRANGLGGLFQIALRADEDQSAGGCGRTTTRQVRQDRDSARSGF
jgi:hypothetical protein